MSEFALGLRLLQGDFKGQCYEMFVFTIVVKKIKQHKMKQPKQNKQEQAPCYEIVSFFGKTVTKMQEIGTKECEFVEYFLG